MMIKAIISAPPPPYNLWHLHPQSLITFDRFYIRRHPSDLHLLWLGPSPTNLHTTHPTLVVPASPPARGCFFISCFLVLGLEPVVVVVVVVVVVMKVDLIMTAKNFQFGDVTWSRSHEQLAVISTYVHTS